MELKGLEWRVARSEWRRVEWGEGDRTGVESGQIGVEESGMARSEWRRVEWSGAARAGVESGQIGVEESVVG